MQLVKLFLTSRVPKVYRPYPAVYLGIVPEERQRISGQCPGTVVIKKETLNKFRLAHRRVPAENDLQVCFFHYLLWTPTPRRAHWREPSAPAPCMRSSWRGDAD